MNDAVRVKICQPVEDALCDFSQYFLASAAAELLDFSVDAVEGAALAELHANADAALGVVHEGAVVAANVGGGAGFVEGEFADDLFLHVWVRVGSNDLESANVSMPPNAREDVTLEELIYL